MTIAPLIDRELRVAARRPATHRVRVFSALGVILIWFFLLLTARGSGSAELSRGLFVTLGVLAFGFGLLSGVFLTADCVSEEKREGTIGLLFLTELKPFDIVAAKVIAHSIQSAYGLLAMLPIVGLSMLMGGVAPGEFWRVAVAIVAGLLLSITWGACVSAISNEAREAMARTLGGVVAVAGVVPASWWLWSGVARRPIWHPLGWPSPVFTFEAAFDGVYRSAQGAQDFWCSLLMVLALGVGFLWLATVILPRTWQQTGARTAVNARVVPAGSEPVAATASRGVSPRLLEANPAAWLAMREGPGPNHRMRLRWVVIVIWFCFLGAALFSRSHVQAFVACMFTTVGIHWLIKYSVAVEATRQLSADHHSGALELLLATPLRESEILRAQTAALRKRFTGVLVFAALLTLSLCWVVIAFASVLQIHGSDYFIFMELFIGGTLVLWRDFRALSAVGQLNALRSGRHSRAILATLGRVMLVPWAGVVLVIFFLNMTPGRSPEGVATVFAFWFALALVNALGVEAHARRILSRGFRRILFERSSPSQLLEPGVWTRLRQLWVRARPA